MKKNLILLLVLITFSTQAQKTNTYFSTKNGAVDGYDVVAYFTDQKPVKGSETHQYKWQGATWKFASIEHLNLFKSNPEKYAPVYGGYCAYGVSKGYKVKIEPEAWAIVNNKLYLNYDLSVREIWQKDKEGYIKEADKNWIKLKEQ